MELAALLRADLAQVEAKLREIERLRLDLRLARIRTIEQGKAQLTPEQRAKLRSLLADPPYPRTRTGTADPPGRAQFSTSGCGSIGLDPGAAGGTREPES